MSKLGLCLVGFFLAIRPFPAFAADPIDAKFKTVLAQLQQEVDRFGQRADRDSQTKDPRPMLTWFEKTRLNLVTIAESQTKKSARKKLLAQLETLDHAMNAIVFAKATKAPCDGLIHKRTTVSFLDQTDLFKSIVRSAAEENSDYAAKTKLGPQLYACLAVVLKSGVDPNMAVYDNGDTAMGWAAYHHSTKIIDLLIKHGGDINRSLVDQGEQPLDSPLGIAAYWGDCKLVKKMVKRGAQVNPKSTVASPMDEAYENNETRFGGGYRCVRHYLASQRAKFKNRERPIAAVGKGPKPMALAKNTSR